MVAVICLLLQGGMGNGGFLWAGEAGGVSESQAAASARISLLATPQVAASGGAVLPIGNGTRSGLAGGEWDVTKSATVKAARWGKGGESVRDMVALPDGSLLVTGLIQGEGGIPSARRVHRLSTGAIGENSMFVGKLADDLSTWEWFSILPANVLVPERMAAGPDLSIYVGGQVPAESPPIASLPEVMEDAANFSRRRRVALLRIAPDGSRLMWARAGGPNQVSVRGMDVDAQGRVYWGADPVGQGRASYVMRVNPDGSIAPFTDILGESSWALYLVQGDKQLLQDGQVLTFYKKGESGAGYDYDGPDGPWGPVRFSDICFRHGGDIVCLPDGDILVSASIFYHFREGANRRFPAFDYFLARYSSEGKLRWSTNLYQEGDSVHTPDQKPLDMVYDPERDLVYTLVKQHGSNIYRFKGELLGDTGNLMITWLGQVDASTGTLRKGWYFQNNRTGKFTEAGSPLSPPHPRLAGNDLKRVRIDGQGRVYLAGWTGAQMWTSPNAYQAFPESQSGGGQPAFVVLDSELRYQYATVVGNTRFGGGVQGRFHALAITPQGVVMGGDFQGAGFTVSGNPDWAADGDGDAHNASLVRFRWP